MPSYIKEIGGFVADVPKFYFERCDKRRFAYKNLTAATINIDQQTIDINGGWSLFQLARLPGQSTMTVNITSAEFKADMFVMTNAIKDGFTENATFAVPISEHLQPVNNKVTLKNTPIEGTISIAGLVQDSAAAEGKFSVSGKEITFYEGDIPTEGGTPIGVDVHYDYEKSAREIAVSNKTTAIGRAVLEYPVYGSGEDCTDADIIGYLYVTILRARVTSQPGFDTSYKTAATFGFELTTIDAGDPNDIAWKMDYVPKAA